MENLLSTYDVCKMRLATGLCSRGAQVLGETNFCLWVAQNTYLFQISLIVLGTQYFIVRSLGVLIIFLRPQPISDIWYHLARYFFFSD